MLPKFLMSDAKVIKRYANRKLYDTERSCYVTLDDIAIMIKAGEEVRVVDNKSTEDLTSVTLAQIIFEAEKKDSFMPMALLRDLIQNGGDAIGEFYRGGVDQMQAAAADFKTKAADIKTKAGDIKTKAHDFRSKAEDIKSEWEGKIGGVIKRSGDQEPTDDGAAQTEHDKGPKPKLLRELAELVVTSQRAFDEFQRGVEERVKGGVGNISRYTHLGADLADIRERLEALEQRLDKFQ